MTARTRVVAILHRRPTAQLRREYLERRLLPLTPCNRLLLGLLTAELERRSA